MVTKLWLVSLNISLSDVGIVFTIHHEGRVSAPHETALGTLPTISHAKNKPHWSRVAATSQIAQLPCTDGFHPLTLSPVTPHLRDNILHLPSPIHEDHPERASKQISKTKVTITRAENKKSQNRGPGSPAHRQNSISA